MGNLLDGVFYRVHGPEQAPVLVFIHGIGMNHQTFQPQVEQFGEEYRVVVMDLPGHGSSADADLGRRFSEHSADCATAILDELEVQQAVFIGQSLGSLVVQHIANRHPERVTATVHLGGMPLNPGYSHLLRYFVGPLSAMCRLIPEKSFYRSFASHRAIRSETKQFLESAIAENGKDLVLRLTIETVNDMTEGIPSPLQKPFLVLVGDKEVGFVRKSGIKWHKKSPSSELAIIPNAGHIANQDNPDAFNRALREFLDDVS